MKKLIFLLFLVASIFAAINFTEVKGIANPAAFYCKELGYEYKIVKTEQGEKGICKLPNKKECDEWGFFSGTCGKEYSYCTKQGYDTKTKMDGKNPYSPSYSVCVYAEGKEKGKEVGLVTDLMNFGEILKSSMEIPDRRVVRESVFTAAYSSSFDWRNYNGQDWMTEVRDQGYECGSCWAFATIGVLESKINIESNDPNLDLDLSEQDLVSCSDAGSCSGGYSDFALYYIENIGVVDELCFPYSGTDESCSNRCSDWNDRLMYIHGWDYLPSDSDDIKNYLINEGPLVAYFTMSGYWELFTGIYRCTTVDWDEKGHAGVIVGYDDADGYWIVKNSWGIGWPPIDPDYSGPDTQGYFYLGYDECDVWINSYIDPPFSCACKDWCEIGTNCCEDISCLGGVLCQDYSHQGVCIDGGYHYWHGNYVPGSNYCIGCGYAAGNTGVACLEDDDCPGYFCNKVGDWWDCLITENSFGRGYCNPASINLGPGEVTEDQGKNCASYWIWYDYISDIDTCIQDCRNKYQELYCNLDGTLADGKCKRECDADELCEDLYPYSWSKECSVNNRQWFCDPDCGAIEGTCEDDYPGCEADPECDDQWPGTNDCDSNCNYVPPTTSTIPTSCSGTPNPCSSYSDENSCTDAGCSWIGECKLEPGYKCCGSSSSCVSPSPILLGSSNCNNIGLYHCSGLCCGYANPSTCDSRTGCEWVSNDQCDGTPSPCSSYTSQSSCETAGCSWSGVTTTTPCKRNGQSCTSGAECCSHGCWCGICACGAPCGDYGGCTGGGGGGGGGGQPRMMAWDVQSALKQPIVIIAVLGIIVGIFGVLKFFVRSRMR